MSGKTPGQAAYEAYRACSHGKSLISGQPIPEWDVLEDDLTAAWEAAATAGADAAFERAAGLLGELNAVTAERDELRDKVAELERQIIDLLAERNEQAARLNRILFIARRPGDVIATAGTETGEGR